MQGDNMTDNNVTPEDWLKLAASLRDSYKILCKIEVDLPIKRYKTQKEKSLEKTFWKVDKKYGELRSLLEELMFLHMPENERIKLPDLGIQVFYSWGIPPLLKMPIKRGF
jgi:hypothetical protein